MIENWIRFKTYIREFVSLFIIFTLHSPIYSDNVSIFILYVKSDRLLFNNFELEIHEK